MDPKQKNEDISSPPKLWWHFLPIWGRELQQKPFWRIVRSWSQSSKVLWMPTPVDDGLKSQSRWSFNLSDQILSLGQIVHTNLHYVQFVHAMLSNLPGAYQLCFILLLLLLKTYTQYSLSTHEASLFWWGISFWPNCKIVTTMSSDDLWELKTEGRGRFIKVAMLHKVGVTETCDSDRTVTSDVGWLGRI